MAGYRYVGGGLLRSCNPVISNLSNHLRPINAMLFKRLVKNLMQCFERIRLKLNPKGQHTDYVIQLCFLFFSVSLCGQPVALWFFFTLPICPLVLFLIALLPFILHQQSICQCAK